MQADPWFSVHDQAPEEAVQDMARVAAATLDHDRQPVVEFSHEVWNPALPQFRRLGGNGTDAWEEAARTYAARTGRTFDGWTKAFGRGFVRVVSVPLDDSEAAERLVRDTKADAVCVRPFLSAPAASADWSARQVSVHAQNQGLPNLVEKLVAAHALASSRGLPVLAYGSDLCLSNWTRLGGSLYCSTAASGLATSR